MPSTLATLSQTAFKIRWTEEYVSAGLNHKHAATVARGIYRGFELRSTGNPYELAIDADPTHSDSIAVVETTDDYSVKVTYTSATIDLENEGVTTASQRLLVIAIYADYSPLTTTSGEIRAYEISPADEWTGAAEKDELIVLGIVTVEAAGGADPVGAILDGAPRGSYIADNVTRTLPWISHEPTDSAWQPVLRDGNFDHGPGTGVAIEGSQLRSWERTAGGASDLDFRQDATAVHSGANALGIVCSNANTPENIALTQYLDVPVESGQRILIRAWTRRVQALGAGTIRLRLGFSGTTLAATSISTITLATSASGAELNLALTEFLTQVPAGGFTYLRWVEFSTSGTAEYASAGLGFLIDDLQLWLQPFDKHNGQGLSRSGPTYTSHLAIHDEAGATTDLSAALTFDKDVVTDRGRLILSGKNPALTENGPELDLRGTLRVGSGTMDAISLAEDPRIQAFFGNGAALGADFYLILSQLVTGAGTASPIKFYARPTATGDDTEFVIALNASYRNDSNNWIQNNAGFPSYVLFWSATGTLRAYFKAAGAGAPWTQTVGGGGFDEEAVGVDSILDLGAAEIATAVSASRTRIRYPLPANVTWYTLLHEAADLATGVLSVRVYAAAGGHHVRTINARWDGTQWVQDDNTAVSLREEVNFQDFRQSYVPAGTGSFAEAAWVQVLRTDPGGSQFYIREIGSSASAFEVDFQGSAGNKIFAEDSSLRITNPTTGATGSNLPVGTAPADNALYAKNMPKHWGCVQFIGAAGASAPSITDGYGVNTGLIGVGTTQVTVNLQNTFGNTDYSVNLTVEGTGAFQGFCFGTVVSRATSSFVFQVYDVNAAGLIDFSAGLGIGNDITVMFQLFGQQGI